MARTPKDIEPRTYNLRDAQGYLVFATDDLDEIVAEAERRLKAKKKADRAFGIDDFDLADLKARQGEERAAREKAQEAAEQSGSERESGS